MIFVILILHEIANYLYKSRYYSDKIAPNLSEGIFSSIYLKNKSLI